MGPNENQDDVNKNDEPQWTSPEKSSRPDNIPIPTANPPEKASLSPAKVASERIGSNGLPPQSQSPGMPTPPPLTTDVRPVRYSIEHATPRAQDLREVNDFMSETQRIRSSSASSLERMHPLNPPPVLELPWWCSYETDMLV